MPPIKNLTFERVTVTPVGFEAPADQRWAQYGDGGAGDGGRSHAYWQFAITPSPTIPGLGSAMFVHPLSLGGGRAQRTPDRDINQHHVDGAIAIPAPTPRPGLVEFAAYGLLGVYVGIIPVVLGLMWYPVMKRMGRKCSARSWR